MKKVKKRRSRIRMYVEFVRHWPHYVVQSICATGAIFIVFLFLGFDQSVITASIGASTFIIFAMPKSISARPLNIFGGHSVGIICGSLCALVPHATPLHAFILYSCAVGLSIFIMVVIDVEHPPASGTALAFAMSGFIVPGAVAVIISALILILIHIIFKNYLRDLT